MTATPDHLRPGEVAVLRTCDASGKSHGGFQWPLEVGAEVVAPDWSQEKKCGNGLHGLLRGEGNGSLLDWSADAKWFVCAVVASERVDLDGKVKFPRCRVLFVGDRFGATELIRRLHPSARAIVGGTSTSGDGGTSTSGDGGTSTSGVGGTSTSGVGGTVQIKWWDAKSERHRIVTGYVGENGIEPGVPYRAENGKLVRAEKQEANTAPGGQP